MRGVPRCSSATVPSWTFPGARFRWTSSTGPASPRTRPCATCCLARAAARSSCFLPGAPEIRRAAERLAPQLAPRSIDVLPLHGGLDADAQDAAIRPSGRPRVILATNLAETTLTVPDVTVVVDTGLHKVARYDPARAIDSLDTERVSHDSADQRAGRAGRVQAGAVVRLWDERDRLRPHREPEIARVDLAGVVLDCARVGRQARRVRVVRSAPAAAQRQRPSRCSSDWTRSTTAATSRRSAASSSACRCIHAWRAF